MIRLAQQGKIETILSCKVSIDLDRIFPPLVLLPLPSRRVCLVEGAPGGGKSTLALHICHQWAQGASWLARFDVVVLVYLRDEAVQNASCLADILPTNEIENSRTIASQIQASYGRNVLFVFDGWDEFPPIKMDKSIVSTIVRQPQKLSLHQSTVLITSRPVASGNLLHIADQRVEILGFTQHQIREYIEKALDGNSTHIQKLVQHLEEHPVIEGYCYIPLHSAILVHIFLTMNGALPTTLHELFCDLVLCCIAREHETHEPDTSLPELSVLDDLPDDLKSSLKTLGKLAFIGVIQNKIVFYPRDLEELQFTKLPSLGLLQAVEGLSKIGKSLSYNFLHLSVQELLAAYRISLMDPSYQVTVFKKLFGSPRFQAVIYYYCGFTKLDNPVIQKFILSYQHDKSSLKELMPLLHCFFEAQQPSLCQIVDSKFIPKERITFNCNELIPVDFLALGFFMTSLLSANMLSVPIIFENIDDHCLRLLLSVLSKYSASIVLQDDLPKEQLILTLITPLYTGKGASHIASHLKSSSTISELMIVDSANGADNMQSGEDGLVHIAEALQTNISLTKLFLRNMRLQHLIQSSDVLSKMLQVNNSLTHLNLSGNNLTDSGAYWLFEGLQQNTCLVDLCLKNNTISSTVDDSEAAVALARLLKTNCSLKHLNLSCNPIFSDSRAYYKVFESLQQNKTLTHLYLHKTGLSVRYSVIIKKMLQRNRTLRRLDLSGNERFTDSGAHCVFVGLRHNSTLVDLNLRKTGITASNSDVRRALTKLLQVNKKLKGLILSGNNQFSHSGVHCIFEGLRTNRTLTHLRLKNNYEH